MHSIHRSIDHQRVEWDRSEERNDSLELALADAWEDENWPRPGINHGQGVLQDLFISSANHHPAHQRITISRRDAMIAATAVQWLGTNCGRSLLETACRRAGYRLLSPSERHYEDNMQHWENLYRERYHEFDAKETELKSREQQLAVGWGTLRLREQGLDAREKTIMQQQLTFIALMILAGIGVFKRTFAPSARRRIELGGA